MAKAQRRTCGPRKTWRGFWSGQILPRPKMAVSPSGGSPQCGKLLGGGARPRDGAEMGTRYPGPVTQPGLIVLRPGRLMASWAAEVAPAFLKKEYKSRLRSPSPVPCPPRTLRRPTLLFFYGIRPGFSGQGGVETAQAIPSFHLLSPTPVKYLFLFSFPSRTSTFHHKSIFWQKTWKEILF